MADEAFEVPGDEQITYAPRQAESGRPYLIDLHIRGRQRNWFTAESVAW